MLLLWGGVWLFASRDDDPLRLVVSEFGGQFVMAAMDESAIAIATSDRKKKRNGPNIRKANSGHYFAFQWKHEPKKISSPSKRVENDERTERVRTGGELESDCPLARKKPCGFFGNIKKRLCIKNFMSCRTKQKIEAVESSSLSYEANENLITSSSEKPVVSRRRNCTVQAADEIVSGNSDVALCDGTRETADEEEEEASWEECTLRGNESIEYHTLRRDDESGPRFDDEEDDSEYLTGGGEMDGSHRTELRLDKEENNFQEYFSGKVNDELESRLDAENNYLGATTSDIAEPRANGSKEITTALGDDDDRRNDANEAKASLTEELLKLSKYGWYWGPISGDEADAKLVTESDGAFLVRDSSDDRYLLTLSFKSSGRLLHSRMEHTGGLFSLCTQPEGEGFTSVAALIDHSMNFSQSAVFCYSRPKYPGHPSFPVRLTKPVSRFTQVRSLQYLCRFVIRQNTRLDNIHKLPLPKTIRGYIEEAHY